MNTNGKINQYIQSQLNEIFLYMEENNIKDREMYDRMEVDQRVFAKWKAWWRFKQYGCKVQNTSMACPRWENFELLQTIYKEMRYGQPAQKICPHFLGSRGHRKDQKQRILSRIGSLDRFIPSQTNQPFP